MFRVAPRLFILIGFIKREIERKSWLTEKERNGNTIMAKEEIGTT